MTISEGHRVRLMQIDRAAQLCRQSERLRITFEMYRTHYLALQEEESQDRERARQARAKSARTRENSRRLLEGVGTRRQDSI
jgi:hypothetical protein